MQIGEVALMLLNRSRRQSVFAMTKFDFDEIDYWLHRWGIWARKDGNKLGYPSRTAESKIGSNIDYRMVQDARPVEETFEQLVNLLPLELRQIAKAEYLLKQGATKKLRAAKLDMTEAKYRTLLTATQWSIFSILGARQDLVKNLPKI